MKPFLKNKFMIDKCVDEMAGNITISGDNEQNTYVWDTRTFRSISSLKREFNNMKVDCSGFNTFDALKLLAYEKLNGHTVQYGKLSSIVDENTNSLIVGSGNAADAKILEILFLEAFYRGTLRVSVELCEDDFAFNKQFLVFYDIRDLSVRQVKKIRNDKYKNEKWLQSVDSKIQSLKETGVLFRIIPNFKNKKFFVDYKKNDGTHISEWITESKLLSL